MKIPLLVFVSFMALALFGQSPSPATTPGPGANPTPTPTPAVEETPQIPLVEFSVFVWPSNKVLLEDSPITGLPRVFYDAPTGPRRLTLVKNSSTPLQSYGGPQPLLLYDVEKTWIPPPEDAPPGTPPTLETKRIPKVRVHLPKDLRRAMVLLFPERKNPDGTLLATVLPYESEKLKPGMARIYNSSDLNLVFQFGDENGPLLKLPPNTNIDFDPKTMSDSEYPRIFGYRLDERNTPTLIHTSKLYFEEEKTIFFVLYPQGNRIRIMRLGGHELQQASALDGSGAAPPNPL